MAAPAIPLNREIFAAVDRLGISGSLLDPTTGTTDGYWQDLQGFYPLSFTIETDATFNGTAQVCVSNNVVKPNDAEHGAPLGSPLGASGGTRTIDAPYRWGKVRVLTGTLGTCKAFVFGYALGRKSG